MPSYFELSILGQDEAGQAFHRVYIELLDWERKLWQGNRDGQARMMAERTGLLDALRTNNITLPDDPMSGEVIDGSIDALIRGAKEVKSNGRSVWIVRD